MADDSVVARYRLRAQKLRDIAAEDGFRKTRETLELVAADIERMARDAEARGRRTDPRIRSGRA